MDFFVTISENVFPERGGGGMGLLGFGQIPWYLAAQHGYMHSEMNYNNNNNENFHKILRLNPR